MGHHTLRGTLILLLSAASLLAQEQHPTQGYDIEFEGPLFDIDKPSLMGGYESILKEFIYPEDALSEKIEGVVTLTCIIDIDGHAQDVKAIIGPKKLLRAAENAVELSQWTPGRVKRVPTPTMVRLDLDIRIKAVKQLKESEAEKHTNNLILGPLFIGIIYLILS